MQTRPGFSMRALLQPPLHTLYTFSFEYTWSFPTPHSALVQCVKFYTPHFGFFRLFAQPQWWEGSVYNTLAHN